MTITALYKSTYLLYTYHGNDYLNAKKPASDVHLGLGLGSGLRLRLSIGLTSFVYIYVPAIVTRDKHRHKQTVIWNDVF